MQEKVHENNVRFFESLLSRQVNGNTKSERNMANETTDRLVGGHAFVDKFTKCIYYSFILCFILRACGRRCTCEMKKWRFVPRFTISWNFVVDLFLSLVFRVYNGTQFQFGSPSQSKSNREREIETEKN